MKVDEEVVYVVCGMWLLILYFIVFLIVILCVNGLIVKVWFLLVSISVSINLSIR